MDPQQYKLNQALLEKLKNKSNDIDTTPQEIFKSQQYNLKEMTDTNMTNNNIQTKWTDNEITRWIMSTTIVFLFLYAMYALYKYELVLPTVLTLISIWLIAGAIIMVKETINRLLD